LERGARTRRIGFAGNAQARKAQQKGRRNKSKEDQKTPKTQWVFLVLKIEKKKRLITIDGLPLPEGDRVR